MPPPKKVPQTNAIFTNLSQVHGLAKMDASVLRMSLDAKATVVLGPFARGGCNRTGIRAVDHDFKPLGRLTPFGLFLPDTKDLSLWLTPSKVTSDFIVDRLEEWWQRRRVNFPKVRTLLLDLDNGPENHGNRSQFLFRLVRFAQAEQLRCVWRIIRRTTANTIRSNVAGEFWRVIGEANCSTASRPFWVLRAA